MSTEGRIATGHLSVPELEMLTQSERDALHEVDLGIERLHRAHGHLVAFHHNTGRGMNHLATAEAGLRAAGHPDLADTLRDDFLPRGVARANDSDDPIDGTWSYAILEGFQATFLDDILAFGETVHAQVANGVRHLNERKQEQEWKRRAGGNKSSEGYAESMRTPGKVEYMPLRNHLSADDVQGATR